MRTVSLFILFSFFLFTLGCLYKTSVREPLLSNLEIKKLLSSRRRSLNAIKGLAKISVRSTSKGIDKTFKAVFSFTRDGYGSLEGCGPFSTIYFKLLYNPEQLYIYIPQKNVLYKGENTADNLARILHFNWESIYFIDYISANLPFDPFLTNIYSVSFSKDYLIRGELSDHTWIARLSDSPSPDILEFCLLDQSAQLLLDISYIYDKNIVEYRLPSLVHFWQKKDNLSVEIKFISVTINDPINEKDFIPPDAWFDENEDIKTIPF